MSLKDTNKKSMDGISLANLSVAALLLIAVIVAYQRVFFAYFQGDDFVILEHNFLGFDNPFHHIKRWFFSGTGRFYRPLSYIVFASDYGIWKTYAPGYHITNIFLHYCTSLLVVGITHLLTGNRHMALGTGLLFSIHPVHVETVAWISGRFDVICGFFFFVSIFLYLKRNSTRLNTRKRIYGIGSISSFAASLFSKEMAITLPFLLIVIDYCFEDRRYVVSRRIRRARDKIKDYSPYFLTLVAYFIIRTHALGGLKGYSNAKGSIHTQFSWDMLSDLIYKLNRLTIPLFSFNRYYAILFLFILIIFIIIRFSKKFYFGILWIFLTIIPIFNLYIEGGIHNLLAERFFYIPSFGFCFFIILILFNYIKIKKFLIRYNLLIIYLIMITICIYYIFHTSAEVKIYRTASEIARMIPLQIKRKYPDINRAFFYFENLPDNYEGAYVYRLGLSSSMKMVYDLYSPENRGKMIEAYSIEKCSHIDKGVIGKTAFCFKYLDGQLIDRTDEMLFFAAPDIFPVPHSLQREDYLIQYCIESNSPDTDKFFCSGWSNAEPWGRWAMTKESVFIFALPDYKPSVLQLNMIAPPALEDIQIVRVSINAKPLGEVRLSEGDRINVTFALPESYLNGNIEVLSFVPEQTVTMKTFGTHPAKHQVSFGTGYILLY